MIVIEERKICRMLEGLFQFGKECEWNDAIEEAMHRFVNLPTIEAEPVRHGKWKHDGSRWENRWVCSGCCYKWFFDTARGMFCPNCGSKMDGGEE